MSENRIVAETRTEFGKGAARRARRAGNVPAVLYGHGTDPQHLNLPTLRFAAILRAHGTNAVLTLEIDGKDQLALTKSVVVHPVRNYIEHADLLVVKAGEKVVVDVPITTVGEAAPSTLVVHESETISVEASATAIPEHIEVSIEGAEEGTQITAGDITLPAGVSLAVEADRLVINVTAASAEEPAESATEEAADVDATEE
jgi:large subunit ribosomal protein L25